MEASILSSTRMIRPHDAEPLLWCGCLAIAMVRVALDDTPPKEDLLSLLLLSLSTCRACFLATKPVRQAKNLPWRMPSNVNVPSSHRDAGGLFMSLLLMPLLCWAIGNTTTQQPQDDTSTSIWYYYAMFVSVSSYVAWEDSLWRHQQQCSSGKLWFAVGLGVIILALAWMARASGYATAIFVLVILWQALYHSMQDILPTSFHGVFTQGEWMVVTSSIAIALTHYCFLYWTNNDGYPTPNTTRNNYATVAMSGLLAAAMTCPIMTAINNRWMTMQRQEENGKSKSKQQSNHEELVALLMQLPLWIGIPLGGVELLEFRRPKHHEFREWQEQQSSSEFTILLEYHSTMEGRSSGTTQSPTLLSTTMMEHSWIIPKSIQWLIQFLMETEQPLVATSLPQMPRFGWLIYWLVVLGLAIPFAPEPPQSDNAANRTQAIVVARKWFHGVAVLLFGPVTLAAPRLLSLAYAIALAILMLLESARTVFPMIQQFHQRYLDPSKDAAHGLVISHMALIVGCALPLWISELVCVHNNTLPPETLVLLQLWGVLSLGVGDAIGAVVGVWRGRIQWSRCNSRTLEGSLAMWMSLLASCLFLYWYCGVGGNLAQFGWQSFMLVTLVTLLEAHTSQIDNLVLPLVGATLLLTLAT